MLELMDYSLQILITTGIFFLFLLPIRVGTRIYSNKTKRRIVKKQKLI